MFHRLLAMLCVLLPLAAGAVYFPSGIDWTNPSQNRFTQSLYLNMLGRAPSARESSDAVSSLRRNDNRVARLRLFESIVQSSEYRRNFNATDSSWQVFRAPDYNYNNGSGFYRYQAALSQPPGFTPVPGGRRLFAKSVAQSVAHYYNAFCYRGDPCIDNPELAHERGANGLAQTISSNAHTCAEQSGLTSQFKWVAVNGTTYPRGIGRNTICLDDGYFKIDQLTLQRFDCDSGYENCRRNHAQDLRASRTGTDNNGHSSLFFRDGSRVALISTDNSTGDTGVVTGRETDRPTGIAHACADTRKTTSRFTWQISGRTTQSKGIGADIICMDNYYYSVLSMTLSRYNCDRGFTNCRADPANNLTAERRTRINGKPGLLFSNGTSLAITSRDTATNRTPDRTSGTSRTDTRVSRSTNTQRQRYRGSDCADTRKRQSQFRWKSNGLSSWPDGVDGKLICLNDSYYELEQTKVRSYRCQRNYSNCVANPGEDFNITSVSEDGMVWTLSNGDQITLITK